MPDDIMAETPSGRIQLGEYVIEEKIGQGGMGQVFKAKQPSLDRMVALKVLPKGVASDQESVDRFYREARNAARLVHPNIVQVYTVGEEKGTPYFAMEYIIGDDLEQRLKKGYAFSVEETVGIIASVAMALACAEGEGIVHRDIKPGNIMIDSHGVVKVTDFGLAKAVKLIDAEITQAGFIVGTPSYMAPEQAEAKPIDHRTDIYALGIVFYELLCAQQPFASDDPATLIYMHVHKAPEPPTSINMAIPPEVEAAVMKCIAKKPEERYQSGTELLKDLVTIQEQLAAAGGSSSETIVFDRRMANVLISSHKNTPGAVAAPTGSDVQSAPSTEETLLVATPELKPWYAKYWPAIAGAAVVLIALVAGLVVALGKKPQEVTNITVNEYVGTPDATTTDVATVDDTTPTPTPISPALPSGLILPISQLKDKLPPDAEVSIKINKALPYSVRGFEDQAVDEGHVELIISKNHYEPLTKSFEINKDTPVDLSDVEFNFVPGPELASSIEDFKTNIAKDDFQSARMAIENIERLDPTSPLLTDLNSQLSVAQRNWSEKWNNAFKEGRAQADRGDEDSARETLSSIPPAHPRHKDAKALIASIEDVRSRVIRGRARIESQIAEGQYAQARATSDSLLGVHNVSHDELAELLETLEDLERLDKEAISAEQEKRYGVAAQKFAQLAKASPRSTTFAEKARSLNELIDKLDREEKLYAAAEGALANNEFAVAKQNIEQLRAISQTKAGELSKKLKLQQARYEISILLAKLDETLTLKGEITQETLSTLFDAENKTGLEQATSSLSGMRAKNVSINRSRTVIENIKLSDDKAVLNVDWNYIIGLANISREISGKSHSEIAVKKLADDWRIAGIRSSEIKDARMIGGVKERGRIQGRIISASSSLITIDKGSEDGVKPKMIFSLYKDATIVRLPIIDEVVAIDEVRIGEWRVFDVAAKTSRATFIGNAAEMPDVKISMLAVESPLMNVASMAPVITNVTADTTLVAPGRAVKVSLSVANIDGVPAYYNWSATGGQVSLERSAVANITWTAPALAGEYILTVQAVTPLGNSTPKTIKLVSTGVQDKKQSNKLVKGGSLTLGANWVGIGDVSFGAEGKMFVHDGGSNTLMRFSSLGDVEFTSDRYRGNIAGLEVHSGHVYILDKKYGMRRYALSPKMFAGTPLVYGKRGTGNGLYARAVDFAVSPTGEVAVLDESSCTIQIFGTRGHFDASCGTKGRSSGMMMQPVGIVSDSDGAYYVLDKGRKTILIFRERSYVSEFSIAEGRNDPISIAYDIIGNRLLVLDKTTGTINGYTTGGVKLKTPIVKARPKDKKIVGLNLLNSPSRIRCDEVGHLYVVHGVRSERLSKFILPSDNKSSAKFAGIKMPQTNDFSKLAVAPDGALYAAELKGGVSKISTRGGWITCSIDKATGNAPTWARAIDIAVDALGKVYVLDSTTIHMCGSSELKRIARFGKKGASSAPDTVVSPKAIAASIVGASSAANVAWAKNEFAAVLLNSSSFGVHVFLPDGKAQTPFPETRLSNSEGIAVGADGLIHVMVARRMQSYSVDGALRYSNDIPVAKTSRMAASSDGTIFVLDIYGRKIFAINPSKGGSAEEMYKLPKKIRTVYDISCDAFGGVYLLVQEGRNKTVQKFLLR